MFYNSGKVRIGNQNIDYLNDTIKAALVGVGYIPDQDGDEFFSDIADEIVGGGYTAGGETLANKAITQNDVDNTADFEADDITAWDADTFTGAIAVIIYKDTGVAGTSPLIAYISLGGARNAPLNLRWPNGDVFKLGDC